MWLVGLPKKYKQLSYSNVTKVLSPKGESCYKEVCNAKITKKLAPNRHQKKKEKEKNKH